MLGLSKGQMKFNKVIITKIKERDFKFICDNVADYKKYLSKNPDMCELIGGTYQQIKPVFDVDAYDEDININEVIADINLIFPNKSVKYAKREPREYKGKMKFSYRLYVSGVRITSKNLKQLLIKNGFEKNPIYDMSIYDSNKVLFLPMTTKKTDENIHPSLIPNNCDIFDCCASYIQEDYEDWDINEESDVDRLLKRFNDIDIKDEDDEDDDDKYLKLKKLINRLKENRSANFDSWIKVVWCIINICKKEEINEVKINRLIHQFSKLSANSYKEDDVDNWISKNFNNVRDNGYGWNYLYQTCIKEDAPEYFEQLTQSYYNVKKEFEKDHAKIIHPPFVVYKDDKNDNIIQPIPLCEKSYRHKQAIFKEKNIKGQDVYKKKKFIDSWLNDPQIRYYQRLVFKPTPLMVEKNEYNTWSGFDILNTPYNYDEEIIKRFLEYSNNLFDNDEVVNYILAYFANRIQNPAKRNKVCIIVYGEEGDGKNRFFDIFRNVFGKKYFTELESAKKMFDNHSCIEKEKLIICVNEAKAKDNFENSEILKARITTDTLIVNPKGIQEFEIDNFCDYIMTTNNKNAVDIKDKSRRYLLTETTSFYSGNSEFFNSFSEDIVDNNNALRVIFEYLKNYDIKQVIQTGNFQSHIPKTEIQKELIIDNRDKIEYFLRDYVDKLEEIDDLKIKNDILFSRWLEWIDINKVKIDYNYISFGTRFGMLIKKRNLIAYIKKDTNKNVIINVKDLKIFFNDNP
jgi:hypothetical protein